MRRGLNKIRRSKSPRWVPRRHVPIMSLPQLSDRACPEVCPGPCSGCPDRIVCRCLGVTEGEIVDAIVSLGLRTVAEVRDATQAGDGCTCCHQEIRVLLAAQASPSSSPICSAR